MRSNRQTFNVSHSTEDEEHILRAEFVQLMTQHQRAIRRSVIQLVGNIHDADDVMQDACVKLIRNFSSYDRSQSFRRWATTIALNQARDFLRKRQRERRCGLPEEAITQLMKVQNAITEIFDLRSEKLAECLQELPRRDQRMIWDCYGNDEKAVAWAEKHDQSVNTVHSRLRRLRKKLFDCVNRKLGLTQRGAS
ncbi:sigma-70 family RNA polymerase sigma factor [Calycomorphotria hydatis]|nr:sigma-70 family RNA polymerase sigma factor [Calycomorphotria hydatis]